MTVTPFVREIPLVSIENVDLVYGDDGGAPAVAGLSMKVRKGEFLAVVGPSGCGKSTLMKLMTGLRIPQKGVVLVQDAHVTHPISIVGMAFQNPTLLPWRTTIENIMLPLEVVKQHKRRLRSHRTEYLQKARALLKLVGLEGVEDKYPWELSGGMQQRASLCRALIHEPELLMLDEPFGALDAFTREELWLAIRDIHAASGVTVVLVTHDLREAVFLADRILVMSSRPGRVSSEHTTPFARPRPLELLYDNEFNRVVQTLRDEIIRARLPVDAAGRLDNCHTG
ncbi:NitT/TauT family transport system ATP-binding protein [Rhodopseudomonas rhenobacensis]|uniref:NitT/TauT family transport system ATP-binding protein n=1 Tax=Rhodopseudomonas rhenobacensis TaxID=87461 RepID=A0A7W7Z8H1_9BRAD|nr:ABC transporter ATP-binding protein [Rhodopseudomonas rhenobacensis]MBB5049966.1 NitT/TauT family transport system ATP-binding protein [Rhodopseudomonas rhenobacensis]